MLVDTHCHLNFEAFDQDRSSVLERAVEAGIDAIVNPGIDLSTSRAAIKLAETFEPVYAAIGVHPNDALTWNNQTTSELRELSQNPKVVAIGEIGLDYYRDQAPRNQQRKIFEEQLSLAADLKLPVIIHTRDRDVEDRQASSDILNLLTEWQAGLQKSGSKLAEAPGVLHSFSGDESAAQRAISIHFMLGITGPVTFRNAPLLQRIVQTIPVEHLLIETDAPFLTPHPHRGKRNEPAYVRLVAEKIAEIHQLTFERIAHLTSANARRLFHWRVIH